jgi:hypothetical protein
MDVAKRVAANVSGLRSGGFGAQNRLPVLNLSRNTKLQVRTSARLTQNPELLVRYSFFTIYIFQNVTWLAI